MVCGATARQLFRRREAQIDDLDRVAALLVVADRRAHQRRQLLQLVGRARLVGARAVGGGRIDAVDQHGDRETAHHAGLAHLAAHRLGDLVIDRLLVAGGLALAAGAARGGLVVGQVGRRPVTG